MKWLRITESRPLPYQEVVLINLDTGRKCVARYSANNPAAYPLGSWTLNDAGDFVRAVEVHLWFPLPTEFP